MTDEQKFTIPLDAPLDINSNDMLVPASSPKFSFNRQKLLGSVLQNSIRYEADGWFAGWWVHNFDMVSLGTVTINPDTLGFPTLQAKLIPGQLIQKYWIVNFSDVNLQFKFSPVLYQHWIEGSGNVERINNDIIRITGNTSGGESFSADVDAYTAEVISATPSDGSLEFNGYLANGIFNLRVTKPFNLDDNMIYLRFGSNLNLGGSFFYNFDGTTHTWGDFLSLVGNTLTLVNNYNYTLEGYVLENEGLENEFFNVHLKTKGDFTIDKELNSILIGRYDQFYSFTKGSSSDGPYVDDFNTDAITGKDATTTEGITALRYDTTTPTYNSWMVGQWQFPIWLKFGELFDVKTDIELYDRHILPYSSATGVVNSYADCQCFITLRRNSKSASVQNVLDISGDFRFVFTVNDIEYTDDDIGTTGLRIPLSPLTRTDRLIGGENHWPVTIKVVNIVNNVANYPLPYGYVYGTVTFDVEIDAVNLSWNLLPPPPPKFVQVAGRAQNGNNPQYLWTLTEPAMVKPADWANPVSYPVSWPAKPANWANPVAKYPAWPAMPADWTPTASWATFTSLYNYGIPLSAAAQSTWSARTSMSYSAYCAANVPVNWPVTLPFPVDDANWEPPWPPQWPFGVSGLPVTEWFDATQTYNQYAISNKPADWPLPWADPDHLTWPMIPESGWVPRTGSYPYSFVVNSVTPTEWTPNWPIAWPFGIVQEPFEWYSVGTSYSEYVSSHWPIRVPASDFNTGGDPGYAWPGHHYTTWPWTFAQDTEPVFPYPADLDSWDPIASYDVNTGVISFNTDPPRDDTVGWPYYTLMPTRFRGTCIGVTLGTDQLSNGYNYKVLNRLGVLKDDRHLFNITPGPAPDAPFALDGKLLMILPICTYGFTIYIVETVDITLCVNGQAAIEAFTLRVLPSNDSRVLKNVWRVDDGGLQLDATRYSLLTVVPYIIMIQQLLPALPVADTLCPFDLSVGYNNLLNIPFDKVTDYSWPERGSAIQSLTNIQVQTPPKYIAEYGFYPLWIVDSYGGQNFWKTYSSFDVGAPLTHKVGLMVLYRRWFNSVVNSKITVAPENDTNNDLAAAIRTSKFTFENAAGRANPWAPGLHVQTIVFEYDQLEHNNITLVYDVDTQATTYTWNPADAAPWDKGSPAIEFTHKSSPREEHHLIVRLIRYTDVYISLQRAFIIDKKGLIIGATIASALSTIITLNVPYGKVDRNALWEEHPTLNLIQSVRGNNTVTLYVGTANMAEVVYLPIGIFWSNKTIKYISYSGSQLVFEYEGVQYTLTVGDDVEARLKFNVTDIRDNTIRELASLDTSDILMAIKQFWSNNVDIENFWWIDKNHVLALTKYDLILYEKDTGVSDWMGDNWKVFKQGRRGDFFNNEDLYYAVSSAYNDKPVLFKLQNKGTYINVLAIADILNTNFLDPVWLERQIPVISNMDPNTIHKLSTTSISSYVPIDIQGLLCSGKISATVVQNRFMLGFALTRGMQQWTCIMQTPSLAGLSVVNGYGHVGLKGDLTGGQYPSRDCDATGFKGTVYPVSDFKDYNKNTNPVEGTDEKIFISGSSIWFVYSELQGIVSHLEFIGGSHVPQIIPISNNYHCDIQISAWKSSALTDTIPRSLGIVDILLAGGGDDSPASTALGYFSAVMLPSIWFMQPVMLLGVFSAQGLHQASYVNRNSLPVKAEDGKSDKDVNVKRKTYRVGISLDIGKFAVLANLLLGIAGSLTSGIANDDLKVEASKDANTPDDTTGRKLGQFASQIILDGISTALSTKGVVYSVKTQSVEILALSMFYTINDGTECWAGPGFVNHNFIGQAVSQGVAATRFKLDRYGAYFPIKIISELLIKGQRVVYEEIAEYMHHLNDNPGGNAGGGLFVQFPIQYILSAVVLGLTKIADVAVLLHEMMAEAMDGLYEVLGPARGFHSGGVERNVIEPEATHSYGNKPMSMFWPAFGVDVDHRNSITSERVKSIVRWEGIEIKISSFLNGVKLSSEAHTDNNVPNDNNKEFFDPSIMGIFFRPFDNNLYLPKTVMGASAKSGQLLPSRMACVEGIVNMLATDGDIKNLQVNCCNYTFGPPPIHDYIISENYKIGVQAANGEIIAYSMDDTKLLDGPASNMIELQDFFGIASSYAALEIKDTYDHQYLRPWAITPTCIALNISGFNCVQNAKAYHGFDGQFNRILSWKGGSGLDSATMVQQYCLVVNDHFKRSNIIPPSEFFGLFNGPPSISIKTLGTDKVANQVQDLTRQKGLDINIPGEDRDAQRYAAAIHSEMLSTLPAVVRMLAPYKLHVIEGITSLTTDVRNTQTKYKAPSSVDFNLYDTMYRATEEYIALLTLQDGIIAVQDKTPSAGLTFIGATTKSAFFYSPATRLYYEFSGSGDIQKKDIFNRFKDIRNGRWDFVNQEVVFKCLLDDNILKNDVSGNVIGRLGDAGISGEIYPPPAPIYNARSDFKILSMAGGLVFQGPKRTMVNRYVFTDDMYDMVKQNKRKWKKLDREIWTIQRDYGWQYDDWYTQSPINAVHGWTHNPFRAATAMLGISEETDCLFEWELTFAWTEQIAHIFEQDEFVVFNLTGETITQGGTLLSRPTHIFLYKELFKNGYYTMRYNSKNGSANRERLYMWGDGMVALESLSLYVKEITKRRMQPLATAQIDVQELHEQ
jgi:hypothetical protein